MKKVNKKGFVLVETLVVTVFVVTLFIFVYRATLPSIGEYEQHNYYDDIDSVYYSNLFKQMITRYANIDYIDTYLTTNTYMDVSDCTDTNLYSNNDYCQLIKNKISVGNDDKIFLTAYNIKEFKKEVKSNDFFDSGTLSNFRDYINTVSNVEPFYHNISSTSSTVIGKYRLFIIRTVEDADGSTSRRYSNIGIYTGTYSKFLMGEKVIFNPGDGDKEFYVLANSKTTSQTVTLILAQNISNGVCFNTTQTSTMPTTLLDSLKTLTNGWTNVPYLTGYTYTPTAGYTINYNGYRARLLEETDILEFLGCKEDDTTCFDVDLPYEVEFNDEKLNFLTDNLTATSGYWTGVVLPNSDYYAWSIMSGKVTPTILSDCSNIGIRPVITVDKANVRRTN